MKNIDKLLNKYINCNKVHEVDLSSPVNKYTDDIILSYFKEKYVIVRSHMAGCFAGYLESFNAETKSVILVEARRMFRWWCNSSISLTGVATTGLKHDDSKIAAELPIHHIADVYEIIPVTEEARKSIQSAPIAEQTK